MQNQMLFKHMYMIQDSIQSSDFHIPDKLFLQMLNVGDAFRALSNKMFDKFCLQPQPCRADMAGPWSGGVVWPSHIPVGGQRQELIHISLGLARFLAGIFYPPAVQLLHMLPQSACSMTRQSHTEQPIRGYTIFYLQHQRQGRTLGSSIPQLPL